MLPGQERLPLGLQVTIRFDDGTVVMCRGNEMDEHSEDISIMPLDETDDNFLDDDNYHLFLGVILWPCLPGLRP